MRPQYCWLLLVVLFIFLVVQSFMMAWCGYIWWDYSILIKVAFLVIDLKRLSRCTVDLPYKLIKIVIWIKACGEERKNPISISPPTRPPSHKLITISWIIVSRDCKILRLYRCMSILLLSYCKYWTAKNGKNSLRPTKFSHHTNVQYVACFYYLNIMCRIKLTEFTFSFLS